MRVTPELSGVVEGRPERIRFAQAATELVVRDGETLQLGGFDQHRDFYDRFLIGSRRGGQAQSLAIELTPRVQPAGRPAGPGERR